ncbi:Chondroitin proteoglycan 7 [Caenorhabditis elegans]|uniref:Chondroitin proteoglycan 7 n=1 Tax=Caenorhabditis elegans TaxID=6239 RepID=CPG7_CAEEL|nr:Chondroitin proteoglycan 7 [Caenorhabditis elegans]Q7YWX9.1 RecName: Full=Chondroitin proteoglycan 7; Flags: Precursor [Caenorhabditis elegans]ABC65817.1 chondroitin proteoglycan-7 [Caenorhabditis elegans]CAE17873.1 Chondroitin proteoglycan 7 [Caenorhabditis elegans]|eukprot:NP_001022243.1 Chondroitin proteoglycan 7 [Caenorhabditis elegans]
MQTITILALIACVAVPIFADFDHLRARRDVVESSGEGSGESSGEKPVVESSGEGSGESSGDKEAVEASGEGSGEGSGDATLESSGEGSGESHNAVVASDSPKDVKALTANEFAVSV